MRSQVRTSRGWMLADLLAAVTVLAFVGAVLVMSLSRTRTMGQLGGSMANLRELGSAMESYGQDNADRVATFGWKKGNTSSQFPDLRNPSSDLYAAGYQAIDIIRRRTPLAPADFPAVTGWAPHMNYSTLVLLDYLDEACSWQKAISPGDARQLKWASDPLALPIDLSAASPSRRYAFRSSYVMPVTYWSSPESGPTATRLSDWYSMSVGSTLGTRRLSEVTYPSQRALLSERYQFFFGPRQPAFLHEESRVPVLTADGSVAVRAGRSTNLGWDPLNPRSVSITIVEYQPSAWDVPAFDPTGSDLLAGRSLFTRNGLGGRDFDGSEVPLP